MRQAWGWSCFVLCFAWVSGCHQSNDAKTAAEKDTDTCSNRIYDPGEDGLDCGGKCQPCAFCTKDDDCPAGFCDSALGFVCSKRCQTDSDCIHSENGIGEFCREDGRCASKVFEIVIEITEPGEPVALLNDCTMDKHYRFQVLWGDEPAGTKMTDTPVRGKQYEDFIHTYEKSGQYTIQIIGQYDNWMNPFRHDQEETYTKVKKDRTSDGDLRRRRCVNVEQNLAFLDAPITDDSDETEAGDLSDEAEDDDTIAEETAMRNNSEENPDLNEDVAEHSIQPETEQENAATQVHGGNRVINPASSSHKFLDNPFQCSEALDRIEQYETIKTVTHQYQFIRPEFVCDLPSNDKQRLMDAQRRMVYAVREIKSYGPVGLGMGGLDLPHLRKLPDVEIPDATKLSSLTDMFFIEYNQPVRWDTRFVTDMSFMFKDAKYFNQPLKLDTSRVTNMQGMFYGAEAFNQALVLDTSQVTDMSMMFLGASAFNQPVDFDTSQVTNMDSMFQGASAFHQPVLFNTARVTSMRNMFAYARAFNQPVVFDTSQVTNMQGMFESASVFNQPVQFDTRNVTDMSRLFYMAWEYDQPIHFDTRNVVTMEMMFNGASRLNQPIVFSDTSKVTTMERMFYGARAFNQPVNFDTSSVTNMKSMFYRAVAFNQPVNFDTSNVTDMSLMFLEARAFNQPVKFDTRKVVSMYGMFLDAKSFNQPVDFDLSSIETTKNMFSGADAYTYDKTKYEIPENDETTQNPIRNGVLTDPLDKIDVPFSDLSLDLF